MGQFEQFVQSEVALYVAARRTLRLSVCLPLCVRVCAISKCLIIVHNIASFSGLLFGFLFVAFALLTFFCSFGLTNCAETTDKNQLSVVFVIVVAVIVVVVAVAVCSCH